MGRVGDQAGQVSNDPQQPYIQQRSVVPQNGPPGPNPAPPVDEDLYYPYDSHNPTDKPESFPPVSQDQYQYDQSHENQVHSFPPVQDDHHQVHAFPPNQHTHVVGAPPQPHVGGNQFHYHPNQHTVPMGHPMVQPASSPFHGGNPPPPVNQFQSWSSTLFDCMKEPENAIITAFFPCVTFGQIAEIMDSGNTPCVTSGLLYGLLSLFLAPCIISCSYRTRLRAKYGLIELPAQDWIVHCFCQWCALCQEYRQLKDSGLDPAIGWLGNQIRAGQVNQYPMVPPPGQRMSNM